MYATSVLPHPLGQHQPPTDERPLCRRTGEWLHAKLRNGHGGASSGATRFLDECLRRLPAGARLFLRAGEGFWGQHFFADCEREQISYTVGASLIASLRGRISEIAEQDWQPASYRGSSEVASCRWRPTSWKQERRFIVRRDPVETGEQRTLEGREWRYWALVTNDSERSADELERWHRAKANLENQSKEAKLGLGLDNLSCRSNLLAWLKLLALPQQERTSYAKRLRFRFIAVAASGGRSGRRLVLRLSAGLPARQRLPRNAATHPRPRPSARLNASPARKQDRYAYAGAATPHSAHQVVDHDKSPPLAPPAAIPTTYTTGIEASPANQPPTAGSGQLDRNGSERVCERERASPESAADDRSLAAEIAQDAEVCERRDAPGREYRQAAGQYVAQELEVGPCQRPVATRARHQ